MVEPGTQRTEGEVERLENAKADFVASFGRRLEVLRKALNLLEKEPAKRGRRDTLKRRVHAMGSAAEVLGFEAIAQALEGVDKVLAASPPRRRPGQSDRGRFENV